LECPFALLHDNLQKWYPLAEEAILLSSLEQLAAIGIDDTLKNSENLTLPRFPVPHSEEQNAA